MTQVQKENFILVENPSPPKLTFATPAPIGLCAYAVTEFAISVLNANWWSAPSFRVVAGMAMYHGGVVQAIAGIFAWIMGNHFGALSFLSYSAFWMSHYHIDFKANALIPPPERHTAAGVFLLPWIIFTAILTIASIRTNKGLFTVLFFLLLSFISLAVGEFETNGDMIKAGGWFGIISSLVAFYCAAAELINAMWEKQIVPLGHFKKD